MALRYTSFSQVEFSAVKRVFKNESELKQAFVEALKEELARSICNKYLVEEWLIPAIDETIKRGRPDIQVSNLVIEVEPPLSGLEKGREQLEKYMNELYEKTGGKVEVYGAVTDGRDAELWVKSSVGLNRVSAGSMADVMSNAVRLFCSQKIPVVSVEDLVRLFGV